mmetsp:Transcript_41208/g.87247  ORF Transcript_41208/g.87247 Transcript_41208/m.87247 type:complete len:223 (-) Transcript_41208:9-677(-)
MRVHDHVREELAGVEQERGLLQGHVLVKGILQRLCGLHTVVLRSVDIPTLDITSSAGATHRHPPIHRGLDLLLHGRPLPLLQIGPLVTASEEDPVSPVNNVQHIRVFSGLLVVGHQGGYRVGASQALDVRVVGIIPSCSDYQEITPAGPLDVLLESRVRVRAPAHENRAAADAWLGVIFAVPDAPVGVVLRGSGRGGRHSAGQGKGNAHGLVWDARCVLCKA